MPAGRPKDSKSSRPSIPQKESWNDCLASMTVGERRYVETTAHAYAPAMRTIVPPETRRLDSRRLRKFQLSMFTAIGTPIGEVRYLICVERTL